MYGIGLEIEAKSFKQVKDHLKAELKSIVQMTADYEKALKLDPDFDLSKLFIAIKNIQAITDGMVNSDNPLSGFVDKEVFSRLTALEDKLKSIAQISESAIKMPDTTKQLQDIGKSKFPANNQIVQYTKAVKTCTDNIVALNKAKEQLDNSPEAYLSEEVNIEQMKKWAEEYQKLQKEMSDSKKLQDKVSKQLKQSEIASKFISGANSFGEGDLQKAGLERLLDDILLDTKTQINNLLASLDKKKSQLNQRLAGLETKPQNTLNPPDLTKEDGSEYRAQVKVTPKANPAEWRNIINNTIKEIEPMLDAVKVQLTPTFLKSSKNRNKDISDQEAQITHDINVELKVTDNMKQFEERINNIDISIKNAKARLEKNGNFKVRFEYEDGGNFRDATKDFFDKLDQIKNIDISFLIKNKEDFLSEFGEIKTQLDAIKKVPVVLSLENQAAFLSSMENLGDNVGQIVLNAPVVIAQGGNISTSMVQPTNVKKPKLSANAKLYSELQNTLSVLESDDPLPAMKTLKGKYNLKTMKSVRGSKKKMLGLIDKLEELNSNDSGNIDKIDDIEIELNEYLKNQKEYIKKEIEKTFQTLTVEDKQALGLEVEVVLKNNGTTTVKAQNKNNTPQERQSSQNVKNIIKAKQALDDLEKNGIDSEVIKKVGERNLETNELIPGSKEKIKKLFDDLDAGLALIEEMRDAADNIDDPQEKFSKVSEMLSFYQTDISPLKQQLTDIVENEKQYLTQYINKKGTLLSPDERKELKEYYKKPETTLVTQSQQGDMRALIEAKKKELSYAGKQYLQAVEESEKLLKSNPNATQQIESANNRILKFGSQLNNTDPGLIKEINSLREQQNEQALKSIQAEKGATNATNKLTEAKERQAANILNTNNNLLDPAQKAAKVAYDNLEKMGFKSEYMLQYHDEVGKLLGVDNAVDYQEIIKKLIESYDIPINEKQFKDVYLQSNLQKLHTNKRNLTQKYEDLLQRGFASESMFGFDDKFIKLFGVNNFADADRALRDYVKFYQSNRLSKVSAEDPQILEETKALLSEVYKIQKEKYETRMAQIDAEIKREQELLNVKIQDINVDNADIDNKKIAKADAKSRLAEIFTKQKAYYKSKFDPQINNEQKTNSALEETISKEKELKSEVVSTTSAIEQQTQIFVRSLEKVNAELTVETNKLDALKRQQTETNEALNKIEDNNTSYGKELLGVDKEIVDVGKIVVANGVLNKTSFEFEEVTYDLFKNKYEQLVNLIKRTYVGPYGISGDTYETFTDFLNGNSSLRSLQGISPDSLNNQNTIGVKMINTLFADVVESLKSELQKKIAAVKSGDIISTNIKQQISAKKDELVESKKYLDAQISEQNTKVNQLQEEYNQALVQQNNLEEHHIELLGEKENRLNNVVSDQPKDEITTPGLAPAEIEKIEQAYYTADQKVVQLREDLSKARQEQEKLSKGTELYGFTDNRGTLSKYNELFGGTRAERVVSLLQQGYIPDGKSELTSLDGTHAFKLGTQAEYKFAEYLYQKIQEMNVGWEEGLKKLSSHNALLEEATNKVSALESEYDEASQKRDEAYKAMARVHNSINNTQGVTDNELRFLNGELLTGKETKAVKGYCDALQKELGETYDEATALKTALDFIFDIRNGDVKNVLNSIDADITGGIKNARTASSRALGVMTGLPVNNLSNRNEAVRSLNPQLYDTVIQERTTALEKEQLEAAKKITEETVKINQQTEQLVDNEQKLVATTEQAAQNHEEISQDVVENVQQSKELIDTEQGLNQAVQNTAESRKKSIEELLKQEEMMTESKSKDTVIDFVNAYNSSDDAYKQTQAIIEEELKRRIEEALGEEYSEVQTKVTLDAVKKQISKASISYKSSDGLKNVTDKYGQVLRDAEEEVYEFGYQTKEVTISSAKLDQAIIKIQNKLVNDILKQIVNLEDAIDPNTNRTLAGTKYESGVKANINYLKGKLLKLQKTENGKRVLLSKEDLEHERYIFDQHQTKTQASVKRARKEIYPTTDFDSKNVEGSIAKFRSRLDAFIEQVKRAGLYTGKFKEEIDQLSTQLDNVKVGKDLREYQTAFQVTKNDYTSLRTYDQLYDDLSKSIQNSIKLKAQLRSEDIGENTKKVLTDELTAEQEITKLIIRQLQSNQELYDVNRKNQAVEQARAKAHHAIAKNEAAQQDKAVKAQKDKVAKVVDKRQSIYDSMLYKRMDTGYVSSKTLSSMQTYERLLMDLIRMQNELEEQPDLINDKTFSYVYNNLLRDMDKVEVQFNDLYEASVKFHANIKNDSDLKLLGKTFDSDDLNQLHNEMNSFAQEVGEGHAKLIQFNDVEKTATFEIQKSKGQVQQLTVAYDEGTHALGRYVSGTKTVETGMQKMSSMLKHSFQNVVRYVASFGSFYEVVSMIRRGVTYVNEIDTALAELKKVTDGTEATYDAFLQTMSKTASVVGSTVSNLTTMAAEWSRLGYSIEDAGKLAESTAILLNVSEFEDATKASEALISTMQAFQYTADESQHVVDVLNEIGNSYAISSDGIATALQDSASALMEGGNSLEQAVALVAAANKVVQDPNSVGSALRTISLRLRGTSVEVLEELGEETEGVVESTSKLQSKIEALSGVNILTDAGAYKDTYTILYEIGQVWEEMSDMDQAALLELMAGIQFYQYVQKCA